MSGETKDRTSCETGFFFLPLSLASLKDQVVLEVGPGPDASVRAFKGNNTQVSIVEPNLDTLALAFDLEWTRNMDEINLAQAGEKLNLYKEMRLDMSWIGSSSTEWISKEVKIYPTTLENLPDTQCAS